MSGTLGGGDAVNLQILRKAARDQIVAKLQAVSGPKDLVLDPELMRPLDRIAGASLLKENGVDKIYKLEPGKVLSGCDKRVYMVRSDCALVSQIADQVTAEQNAGHRRSYYILLVPRKLHLCELTLERAGVYGLVNIDELPLDLIPLDTDLLSLEMPHFYRSFFLEGDQTWCHVAARSLVTLQHIFGTIPNVYGIGRCAQMVSDLAGTMMDKLSDQSHLRSDIGHLFLIDRDADYITPFCSQVTYEGLLDDTFGISSGYVEFGPDVTGRDQGIKLLLTSEDLVFDDIRNRHFSSVAPYLSSKAKELQTGYDKRHQLSSVSDMKDFVANDLKDLKQQHKSLSLHVAACEAITRRKTNSEFEDQLRTEHSLLEGVDTRESINNIEEMINRQYNITQCLRLLCLLSLTNGGLQSHVYKSLKTQFVQSFGFDQLLTLHNLKRAGLVVEAETSQAAKQLGKVANAVNIPLPSPFRSLSKRLNLIPKSAEEVNLRSPSDMSYVFSGAYSPLLCKIVEQVLIHEGFLGLEDLIRLIAVPTFADIKAKSVKGVGKAGMGGAPTSRSASVVLVYFLGGCSYSEITALRFLGKQRGYKFIVATTSILKSTSLIENCVERT